MIWFLTYSVNLFKEQVKNYTEINDQIKKVRILGGLDLLDNEVDRKGLTYELISVGMRMKREK